MLSHPMFDTRAIANALSRAGRQFYYDGHLPEARAQYVLAAQVWAAEGYGRLAWLHGLVEACIGTEIGNADDDRAANKCAREIANWQAQIALAPVVAGAGPERI